MALLFMDGFDYAAVADVDKRWGGRGAGLSFGATAGRWGGGAIASQSTASSITAAIATAAGTGDTVCFAMHFKSLGAVPTGNSSFSLATFLNATGDPLLSIYPSVSGTITVLHWTAGALGTFPAGTLFDGNYHHIEVNLTLSLTTTGALNVYVDGVSVLSVTGAITSLVTAGVSSFGLGSVAAGAGWQGSYDDIVIWDSLGTNNNTFPKGVKRITTLVPNAAGDSTQFVPSTGANYQAVSAAYSVGSSVSDTSTGKLDLYQASDLPIVPAVVDGVFAYYYAGNPGGGTAHLTPKIKTSGTTASGTTVSLANGANNFYPQQFATDAGGSAWTATSINALQIGMAD